MLSQVSHLIKNHMHFESAFIRLQGREKLVADIGKSNFINKECIPLLFVEYTSVVHEVPVEVVYMPVMLELIHRRSVWIVCMSIAEFLNLLLHIFFLSCVCVCLVRSYDRESFNLKFGSQDVALGIVLQAAGSSNGWTTGSGLEGPSYSMEMAGSEMPGPIFSKSPRRRMRVAFTCNVCGHRTTRAINPHAYTDGTVFVQVRIYEWLNFSHQLFCTMEDRSALRKFV